VKSVNGKTNPDEDPAYAENKVGNVCEIVKVDTMNNTGQTCQKQRRQEKRFVHLKMDLKLAPVKKQMRCAGR